MEFTIAREELLHGLYLTQGIVERRTTIPILAHVLLETNDNGVSIAATDQEVGVRRVCEAKVKKKGSVTTGARKLYEIVRECPEGALTLRSLENNWIGISSGKSKFKIVGLDPREFPAMPVPVQDKKTKAIDVPGALLQEMIQRTIFAVSTDETRLNLSGVNIERPEAGKLRLIATDGHRLSMITRAVEGVTTGAGVIIPRKGMAEIAKVLETSQDTVKLTLDGGVAHAGQGNVELSMRLVEGDFPDYNQVVPQKSERRMLVKGEDLLSALRRVSVVSSERTRGVKLEMESGRLEVSSMNPDLGEASEELTVEYDSEPFKIGFNAKYVIDVLGVLPPDSQIEIGFNDEVSPGVLRCEGDSDFLYVVMPMRL
jgi:DNA polymerase-3 subunit beta